MMMMNLLYSVEFFPWIGFLIGCCLGSFLNVVAYRVPRDMSVVRPRSSCPTCSVPIPWNLNIPVISWLVLRGRAHCCSCKISPRYFIVEILVGFVFFWIFQSYLLHQNVGILLTSSIFAWLLIAVVVIDFETMLIPDRLSIGGACIGFFLSFFFPIVHGVDHHSLGVERLISGLASLLGILVGSGLLYWIGALASHAFGREALGEGDVKLLGCVGAFCGWEGAVFCIFGGALIGTFLLILLYIWQKIWSSSEGNRNQLGFGVEIPFGPYLALAALGYFLGLKKWIDPWFEWVEQLYL